MASKISSRQWTVETIDLNQPLVIHSGYHQVSPEFVFRPEQIEISGDSHLFGIRLGSVDENVILVEINDSAFLEVAIDGVALCEPERQMVPELAQIALYSGRLVWNGCGQVYWPENIEPQRTGQSWQLITELPETASGKGPVFNSTLSTVSNQTLPTDEANQDSSSGLSTAQIGGIIVGTAVIVVVVAFVVISVVAGRQSGSPAINLSSSISSFSLASFSLEWINKLMKLNSSGSGFVLTSD